jgi:hypothetical protein
MRLYHGTVGWSEAEHIRAVGFADRDDHFFVPPIAGVHLVDRLAVLIEPLALVVEVPAGETELHRFELVEEGKPYREWFVPASWLNRHAVIVAHEDTRPPATSPRATEGRAAGEPPTGGAANTGGAESIGRVPASNEARRP